jgi:hypothetical protein
MQRRSLFFLRIPLLDTTCFGLTDHLYRLLWLRILLLTVTRCSTVVASGYFGYMGYHQFYLGVLGLYVVAFGFVWFVGCGCVECSCWGGSSVVCWSAGVPEDGQLGRNMQ